MSNLKCPKCGEIFQIDESDYLSIAQQVRDTEFQNELERRVREVQARQTTEINLIKMEQGQEKQIALSQKDSVIAEKDQEIMALRIRLQNIETEKALAVSQAVQEKDKELSDKNNQILSLENSLSLQKSESALKVKSVEDNFAEQLRMKEEQIAYYRDFKAKQSTKMIGESLEQHCLYQFNSIRMTAFPNAYFEKDNDARTGSKGDFIFRESRDSTEFISIMFEMKNEGDTTATKHKNEDFFKELDKDRREKKCEYAVLVSLLESDNDFYNNGIVEVYQYPKMYVVRPQFFLTIISLLRNAALNSLQYQTELRTVRNQQLDLTNFEDNMNAFKDAFARNYRLASERFATAIEEIDKTIDHLQKTKAALLSSENNLRLANNKADELSIKKLTKNAPSVREMFERREREENERGTK